MTFAEVLKQLMENRGWTAYRLSRAVPCSQTSVSNWLSGKTTPNPTMQRRVLEVLNREEMGENQPPAVETERPTSEIEVGYMAVLEDVEKFIALALDQPYTAHRLISFAIQELELRKCE